MSAPAVSIYIITYLNSEERGQVLKRTCEAALMQRYPNFEVVVSDNAGSYSAADALATLDDPRLRICTNKENAGFTGNINRCLEHCSFDIIKLLCDDDLIHPDFLSATVPLVNDNAMVVVGVQKFIFGNDPKELDAGIEMPSSSESRAAGYGYDIWHIPHTASCIPSATIFTRNLFRELGGYDPKTILSDWDFFIEACLYKEVIYISEILCFVGVWAGSLTEEMKGDPYFFPRESLYTIFRVLHCKSLPIGQCILIWLMVFKELMWQGLRPIKHPLTKDYWLGFIEYFLYQIHLMFRNRKHFGPRPHHT